MKKIVLKNCDVNAFSSLIKKSSALDKFVFIDIVGSEFKSTTFNKNKSALKAVTANLEEYCDGYTNECEDELVKIQFVGSDKLTTALGIVGTEGVNVTFFIEDNGYAKKVVINNSTSNITVPAAAKEAITFLEIPDGARKSIFEDYSTIQYKVGISNAEYKKLSQFFGVNKDSCRVCFTVDGDEVTVSEIESTDENLRDHMNELIEAGNIADFKSTESLYTKKLSYDTFENSTDEGYLSCFNKMYFQWIDDEKHYDIELHTNKIKFVSVDDKGTTTYVVFNPVPFA